MAQTGIVSRKTCLRFSSFISEGMRKENAFAVRFAYGLVVLLFFGKANFIFLEERMIKRIALALVVMISVFALFACAEGAVKAKVDYATETETVITVTETDGNATLIDAMKYLKAEEELSYKASASVYGEFIETVGNLTAEGNYYWAVYSTDQDVCDTQNSVTVNGVTYYYTMVGSSMLKVKEGESYLLRYESFA